MKNLLPVPCQQLLNLSKLILSDKQSLLIPIDGLGHSAQYLDHFEAGFQVALSCSLVEKQDGSPSSPNLTGMLAGESVDELEQAFGRFDEDLKLESGQYTLVKRTDALDHGGERFIWNVLSNGGRAQGDGNGLEHGPGVVGVGENLDTSGTWGEIAARLGCSIRLCSASVSELVVV